MGLLPAPSTTSPHLAHAAGQVSHQEIPGHRVVLHEQISAAAQQDGARQGESSARGLPPRPGVPTAQALDDKAPKPGSHPPPPPHSNTQPHPPPPFPATPYAPLSRAFPARKREFEAKNGVICSLQLLH